MALRYTCDLPGVDIAEHTATLAVSVKFFKTESQIETKVHKHACTDHVGSIVSKLAKDHPRGDKFHSIVVEKL